MQIMQIYALEHPAEYFPFEVLSFPNYSPISLYRDKIPFNIIFTKPQDIAVLYSKQTGFHHEYKKLNKSEYTK